MSKKNPSKKATPPDEGEKNPRRKDSGKRPNGESITETLQEEHGDQEQKHQHGGDQSPVFSILQTLRKEANIVPERGGEVSDQGTKRQTCHR